ESWKFEPDGVAVLNSGIVRNEGETRNAYRIASADSAPVGAGVVPMVMAMKRVTSASVSGRRKARRPNVLMVFVKHVWPAVPAAAGSHVMNFAFWVALAMTAFAICEPPSFSIGQASG